MLNQSHRSAPIQNKPPHQGRSGEHISDKLGSGLDFAETRRYQPGDDPRHIDWRASARGHNQTLLVRRYHAEHAQTLAILIDRRSSMAFGTRKRLKITQALRAALMLLGPALKQGLAIGGVILEDPHCQTHWHPAQTGLDPILRFMQHAARPFPPPSTEQIEAALAFSWPRVFSGLNQQLSQGSQLILISDFAGLNPDNDQSIRDLGRHHNVHTIRIEDPAETLPAHMGHLGLRWGARLMRIDTNATALHQQHLTRVRALEKAFHRAGFNTSNLSTEQDEFALTGITL